MRWQTIVFGLMLQVILVFGSQYPKNLNIWPMPESVEYGNQTFYLSKDFHLTTDGSKYKDASGILKDGFARLLDVVTANNVIEYNFGKVYDSFLLQGIHVVVHSESDELQYNIDESYKLYIHPQGNPVYANIEAATVYGALHALQTFSQLCHFNLKTRKIVVNQVPWTITDRPRFSYRGLLIDTSRHYQPLQMIKKVIDSMAYAKLNVLHWHIVDRESFPLEIPSFPKLWNGAYSITERYTMAVAADIVSYAKRRGINVLAELDVPGHAKSWGVGYPALWPSKKCQEPLDVSSDFTFKLIDGVLSDFSQIFKYRFVHLGGDEVDTSCWSSTPRIQKWLEQKGLNESQAYEYFVLKAQKIAVSHGYEVINWEETFNQFGSKLDRKTIVHNWLGSGVAERVVATGLRCIVSNQDKWYLDHLDTDWSTFYMNEPLTNITNPEQQKLVLGGEVCMWGETVDGSDIEQTIWPRAAAAAERLWTRFDKLPKDPSQVASRLANFRCLLNQRGVAAAPLDGLGRAPPIEAGSCYVQ
uniref:beta-hexosaminidase 3 n=1 Tax=Erigeron canadensis TaxID=72917 RepID=UPI001CB90A1E|nr:beta-hexosaminidase 3 [Erigeron canadensis]